MVKTSSFDNFSGWLTIESVKVSGNTVFQFSRKSCSEGPKADASPKGPSPRPAYRIRQSQYESSRPESEASRERTVRRRGADAGCVRRPRCSSSASGSRHRPSRAYAAQRAADRPVRTARRLRKIPDLIDCNRNLARRLSNPKEQRDYNK